ncbi:hypothetical protein GHT06_009604 [Daphnia sinensis]|uniref:Single domain-containing protein n=1 Tax=Daphnia sinensis TaxID=1820382 RepID=A0AAD5L5W1_9CRUS|nr:hypothetical protein GHT06_009604 [Daphnia sinensis]
MLSRPSFLLVLACAYVHVSAVPLVGPLAIRPLICINKITNQSGVCMFTMDCHRINGTALGVCGDRFYFGSCCVVPALDEELNVLERTAGASTKRWQTPGTYLLEMKEQEDRSLSSSEELQIEDF